MPLSEGRLCGEMRLPTRHHLPITLWPLPLQSLPALPLFFIYYRSVFPLLPLQTLQDLKEGPKAFLALDPSVWGTPPRSCEGQGPQLDGKPSQLPRQDLFHAGNTTKHHVRANHDIQGVCSHPMAQKGNIFFFFLTLKEQTVFCLPMLKRGQVRWLVPAGSSATCCVEGLPKVQHCLWTAEDKSSSSMAGSSGMLGISWWQMTDPQTAVSQFMALVRSLEQNTSPLHYPGPSLRAFAEGKYMQKVFLVWFL